MRLRGREACSFLEHWNDLDILISDYTLRAPTNHGASPFAAEAERSRQQRELNHRDTEDTERSKELFPVSVPLWFNDPMDLNLLCFLFRGIRTGT